jgi:hypothetical protein
LKFYNFKEKKESRVHAVPDLMSPFYTYTDKKIVESISSCGAFVVSTKDFERFNFDEKRLVQWQMKIIV